MSDDLEKLHMAAIMLAFPFSKLLTPLTPTEIAKSFIEITNDPWVMRVDFALKKVTLSFMGGINDRLRGLKLQPDDLELILYRAELGLAKRYQGQRIPFHSSVITLPPSDPKVTFSIECSYPDFITDFLNPQEYACSMDMMFTLGNRYINAITDYVVLRSSYQKLKLNIFGV